MKTNASITGFWKGYFMGVILMGTIALIIVLCSCEPIEQGPGIITDNDTITIIIKGR